MEEEEEEERTHCEREVFVSGYVLSNRSIPDLLQNCDLPPPLKLFSPIGGGGGGGGGGEEEEKRKTPPSKVVRWGGYAGLGLDHGGDDPSLRRALQLSQTRAREAEKEAAAARTRNRQMAALLLEESLRLSAHRRWMKLLEIEISVLQKKGLRPKEGEGRDEDAASAAAAAAAAAAWCFALALCLGIAGVGFALGRRCFDWGS